jgi:hypothetical protein
MSLDPFTDYIRKNPWPCHSHNFSIRALIDGIEVICYIPSSFNNTSYQVEHDRMSLFGGKDVLRKAIPITPFSQHTINANNHSHPGFQRCKRLVRSHVRFGEGDPFVKWSLSPRIDIGPNTTVGPDDKVPEKL